MISFRLALAFGVEVLLCVFVCAFAWDISVVGLPLGAIIVLVVLTLLAVRFFLVLVEFLCAHLWRAPRSPEMRIGPVRTVGMVLGELAAFLFTFFFLIPLSRYLITPRRGALRSKRQLPVLFIHGYGVNAGVWAPMIDYLWEHGLTDIFAMNLQPRWADMDDYAQQVAARVNRICTTLGVEKVILVGHSMGALVARAYVERCGGSPKVAKLISIGAPHHGTRLARFAPGINARQMRCGSEWLEELNRDENVRNGSVHVSVFSAHDNQIVPQDSSELGKARNIALPGLGHIALLFSREVGQLVYREVMAG